MERLAQAKYTKRRGIGTGKAIVVVFIIGLFFTCVFVDIVTCPHCGGSGVNPQGETLEDIFCSTCGRDGKVTVLEYFAYMIFGGVKNGG